MFSRLSVSNSLHRSIQLRCGDGQNTSLSLVRGKLQHFGRPANPDWLTPANPHWLTPANPHWLTPVRIETKINKICPKSLQIYPVNMTQYIDKIYTLHVNGLLSTLEKTTQISTHLICSPNGNTTDGAPTIYASFCDLTRLI